MKVLKEDRINVLKDVSIAFSIIMIFLIFAVITSIIVTSVMKS